MKKHQVAALHIPDLLNNHLNDIPKVTFSGFQAILVNISSLKQGKEKLSWSSIVAIGKTI